MNVVGLTRVAFVHLLQALNAGGFCATQADGPGGRRRLIDERTILAICLQWVNCRARQKTLCLVFSLTPATFSRYLNLGLRELGRYYNNSTSLHYLVLTTHSSCRLLPTIPECAIRWPTAPDMRRFSNMISAMEPLVKDVWGGLDGLEIPVEEPGEALKQNAYFNGWKHHTKTSSIFVYAPDGTIAYVKGNLPGSWHDSWCAAKLRQYLLDEGVHPRPFSVCSDTAFSSWGKVRSSALRLPVVLRACHVAHELHWLSLSKLVMGVHVFICRRGLICGSRRRCDRRSSSWRRQRSSP